MMFCDWLVGFMVISCWYLEFKWLYNVHLQW